MSILKAEKDPERAQAVIHDVDAHAEHWRQTLEAAEQAVADVKAGAGDMVLAAAMDGGDNAQAVARELAEKVAYRDVAAATLAAAQKQQVMARVFLHQARAHQWRQQAGAKERELEAHQAKVWELLAPLQELEGGTRYVPYQSPRPVPGMWVDPVPYTVPRSQVLQAQVNELRHNAELEDQRAQNILDSLKRVGAAKLAETYPQPKANGDAQDSEPARIAA